MHCRSAWVGNGVVSALEVMCCLENFVLKMTGPSSLPSLPTCSAGVGRTGTLIAIDIALEQATQENVVDIPAIVTKMR